MDGLVKKGKTENAAQELLKKVESLKEKEIKENLLQGFDYSANHLNDIADLRLASAMGSILALCVARFNENAKSNVQLSKARSYCLQAQKQITAAQKEVWESLKNKSLHELRTKSQDLTKLAADFLLNGLLPYSAAVSAKRKSKPPLKIEEARLALLLGELIRLSLFSIALGKKATWLSNISEQTDPLKEWLQAARKLPFDKKEPKPKITPISRIISDPRRFEGKWTTIEGLVEKIEIKHKARKAISIAQVADGKGKSVTVVLPYIKLDSGGLVAGSYVNITGVWKNRNKETDSAALMIDRLSLKELSEKSWLYWAKFELTSIFQTAPHGLNAKWSWELGSEGPGNQLRYSTWFIRKEAANGL